MKKALLFLSFGLATSGIAVACSSTDRPAAATSGSASSAGGVVTTDAGADVDAEAGLPRENDALCMGLPAPPRVLEELTEPIAQPPAYGGEIAEGVYELDELDVYDANASSDGGEGPTEGLSGKSGSGTLTVTSNTMAFNDAYGPNDSVPAPAARGYAYYFSASTIFAAQVCPNVAVTQEIPFSVSGASIILLPDSTHRVVYRLKGM